MIDNELRDRIKDANDIVDVIGEFVTLRKRGINYLGICPFHADRTPSMTVSSSRQSFKCFVCGKVEMLSSFFRNTRICHSTKLSLGLDVG